MNAPNGKTAGIILMICAGLTVFALSLHPSAQSAPFSRALLAEIIRLGPMDRAMHGALMVILTGIIYALVVFSVRAGLHNATVLLAMIAYTLGALFWFGAAAVDGFLTPAIAAAYAQAPPASLNAAHQLLVLNALSIQVLTKLGIVAASSGILLWSLHLMRVAGAPRWVGIGGVISSLVFAGLVFGGITLTAHNVSAVFSVISVWLFAVGLLLNRERI